MRSDSSVSEVAEKYRIAAAGTASADSTAANHNADILLLCYKELRKTEAGQQAIQSLLGDANAHVQCWSAAHSLEWAPNAARLVLEALRDSDGDCSFDAKWTLKEYDNGKLRFM